MVKSKTCLMIIAASSPKISVRTVDYLKDHADAEKVKDAYRDRMAALADTNLVIFTSANGTNVVSSEASEPI